MPGRVPPVERGQHADVMHVRFRRGGQAVAIHRQAVHDVQIHHLAMHVADHGLIGFGHRFEECILRSFHHLSLVTPAEWIQRLPFDEAMPMDTFLSAPPKLPSDGL